MARWPGLGTYTLTHNRFRLFQQVQPGETDYGLVYFDRVGQLIRDAGFAQGKAALVYQLLMNLVLSIVVERENRLAPSHHADFIVGYVSQFDASAYPGADFLVGPFARLDTETTLECSLHSLLDTFTSWRNREGSEDAMVPLKTGKRTRGSPSR